MRLYQYLIDRSLWLDEADLTLNIIRRGASTLLTKPLELNQGAPAGFLLVERLDVDIFGKSEYVLRAFPLLCGLAALPLFVALARRVIPPVAVVIATAFFAVSGPLIYYSSEVKQYSADTAATLALTLMSTILLSRSPSRGRAIAFGLIGALLIQFSFAAVIVAAATGAVIAVSSLVDGRRRFVAVLPTLVLWGVGAILFLPFYFHNLRGYALEPTALGARNWYVHRVEDFAAAAEIWHRASSPWIVVTFATALIIAVGLAALARENTRVVVLLVTPVALTLVLGAAGRYLIEPRSLVFLVPFLFICAARGIAQIVTRLPPPAALAAAAILAVPFVVDFASFRDSYAGQPMRVEEIKGALADVARNWRRGDVLYVQYGAESAFAYYAECDCFRLPRGADVDELWPVKAVSPSDRTNQFARVLQPRSRAVIIGRFVPITLHGGYRQDVRRIRQHSRAWVLITWSWNDTERAIIRRDLLDALGRRGRRVESRVSRGAQLHLYTFPTTLASSR